MRFTLIIPMNQKLLRQTARSLTIVRLALLCTPVAAWSEQTRRAPPAAPFSPTVRHAARFTSEQRHDCTLLTVSEPWRNAKAQFRYALVPHQANLPRNLPKGTCVVRVPVRRVVLLSPTYMAYFDMLGLADRIVGVSNGELVNTPAVARRIAAGAIHEVGTGAAMTGSVNLEKLFLLQPDLIMAYATGNSQFDTHPKLLEAGFSVAVNAEYMETTPLGRTEWMKFIAAFFGADEQAETLFAAIETEYRRATALAAAVARRPTVFCNLDFNGTWHMPGGRSFMATFLRDAGARYLWQDDASRGGIPLGVEAVIGKAQDADVWLDPGACRSLRDIEAADERYRLFKAWRNGRVYSNDATVNTDGGNDYWETGVANPHLILRDLIGILHPTLLPEHQLRWYRQLQP